MPYTDGINMELLLSDVLIGRVSINDLSAKAVRMLREKRDELARSEKSDDQYRARELSETLVSASRMGTPHFGNGLLPIDW